MSNLHLTKSKFSTRTAHHQRNFLQAIANKFDIKAPSDWGKLSKYDFEANGGRELLARYGSIASILKKTFPEIQWNSSWFQNTRVQYYWNNFNTQRKLLDEMWKKLNIKDPSEWANVTKATVEQHGGSSVLEYHGKSLAKALTQLYPEIEWKREWFNKPSWNEVLSHREFFDKVAKNLGINHPSGWGKISIDQIREFGATPQIMGSFYKSLKNAYPEVEWNSKWFSKLPGGYWENRANLRNFLEKLAANVDIKEPKDWGKMNNKKLISHGGGSALRAHGNSLIKTLQFAYPDVRWKVEWFTKFPHRYWKDKGNQRNFLDKVANEFHIKSPKEWGKITTALIIERGGASLIKAHKESLYLTLKNVYTEVDWKPEWFGYRIYNKEGYWSSLTNQKEFLTNLYEEYNLASPIQWKTLTKSFIKKKGGNGLLHQYNNSLRNALRTLYPNESWFSDEPFNLTRPHKTISSFTERWIVNPYST